MTSIWRLPWAATVALLAEGVDRNRDGSKKLAPFVVALLAEGVDRNITVDRDEIALVRRPPRGGRG